VIAVLFLVVLGGFVLGALRRAGMPGSFALGIAFMVAFGKGPPDGADLGAAALLGSLVFAALRLARS
jgi:hypothetical protein